MRAQWGLSLLIVTALAGPARAAAGRCPALGRLAVPAGRITIAELEPAGNLPVRDGVGHVWPVSIPAHCLVRGVTAAHQGADGKSYAVGFELRLPIAWNHRLLFQGGSGLDGAVRPAIGVQNAGPPALARGFAVLSMDGGHEGPDAAFAADQQARLDFAYQALGKALAVGRRVVRAFYAAPAAHAYFDGCSNGGREALIAAERYPLAFDGIVAGDPGFRLSHAAIAEAWNDRALAAIAPRDAAGRPDFAAALSDADLQLVANRVRAQCDALDGLADGIIANPEACHFRLDELACHPGQTGACLTAPKLAALQAIVAGAHDSAGRPLYAGFPIDTGIAVPGWRIWMLGIPHGMPGLNFSLGIDALRHYFLTPAQPGLDVTRLDFDQADTAVAETAALNDATATELSSFSAHGGKLLLYQGYSDPVFSAADLVAWFRQLGVTNADLPDTARLFLVPGMTHCEGGIATDQFDPLAAIVAWVEHHAPPDRIIAQGARLPGVTRPLCPYPAYARYQGGDTKSAASFACVH